MTSSAGHLSSEQLLDYWLHDSDVAATEAVDEHLMQCDACGAALDEIAALGDGVRDAFRAGLVAAVVPNAFVEHLQRRGMRIREYRLAHNGSVNCSVAPDDELLVARIDVPLAGVRRLDAVATASLEPGIIQRLDDIPFDAVTGQVIYLPRLADVKRLPKHEMTLSLRSHEADGEREIGRYVFRHTPWSER